MMLTFKKPGAEFSRCSTQAPARGRNDEADIETP